MKRNKWVFLLDAGLFLGVCGLESKVLTGVPAHEWLGTVFAVALLVHLLLQWPWVESQFRRLFSPGAIRARINYFLNAAIFICMAAAMVSGFMISEYVLPRNGRQLDDSIAWHTIHGNTGHAIMFLAGLHVALNWDWIVAAIRGRAKTRPALEVSVRRLARTRRHFWYGDLRRLGVLLFVTGLVAIGTFGMQRVLIASGWTENDAYAATRRATENGAMPLPPRSASTENRTMGAIVSDSLHQGRFVYDSRHPSLSHGYPAFIATIVIVCVMAVAGRKVLKLRL